MATHQIPGFETWSEDGKLYAKVTLRQILDVCDLSDTPILAEFKRLYDENDEMRELLGYAKSYFNGEGGCSACPIQDKCVSLPRCTFPDYFKERVEKYA